MNKQAEPLVSIVICFFNEERFLEEAITSVLNQDYNHWELILVDDGSTDQSTNIALNFEEKFHYKIQYRQHNNHINNGLSASRNLGIKNSKGELVAFLDADDFWLPSKLSQQVSIFSENPSIGMLTEASLYWYDWNDKEQENYEIAVGAAQNIIHQPPFLAKKLYPLGNGAAPCPSSLMLRKMAIENVGYFEESFTKAYTLYEDQAFLSKIYLKEEVYISASCNNLYRQRHGSIVKTVRTAGLYNKVRRYYLNWFKSYLKQHNIQEPEIDSKVKRALLHLKYCSYINLKNKILNKVKRILK